MERAHDVVGQSVALCEGLESAPPVAGQPASVGPDPQGAFPVLQQGLDAVAPQGARRHVEDREADAVEAHETAVGPEPEVSVAGLDDGGDGVLGKLVGGGPDVEAVLGEGLPGVETQGRGRGRGSRTAHLEGQRDDDRGA